MNAHETIKQLRADALGENSLDKIWNALEVLAKKIDETPAEASKSAINDINRQLRMS